MNKKVKVLHLLRSDNFSGAENVVCQIINMFREDKFEMVYCSPDGEIRRALEENDIHFCPLKKFCLKEVRRAIREYKPDIIHAHDISAGVAAAITGNLKIISHMHVNHQRMSEINFRTILYAACSLRFKHIYWVSKSSFENYRFRNFLSRKSSILYNIVDRDRICQKVKQDSTFYDHDIVYVGRLTYQKNPERLLRVLRLVVDKNPEIKALIVGNGDLFEESKLLSSDFGLEKNVFFLGFQSNPLKMLHDAKVMVMTSRFEGTPICALEAMAMGVPIVSTPTDGLVDLIENDVTGYLADEDHEMAQKILAIITDNQKQNQMAENSIKRFTILNDKDAYKRVLERCYLQ